jgi:hypothetical protein
VDQKRTLELLLTSFTQQCLVYIVYHLQTPLQIGLVCDKELVSLDICQLKVVVYQGLNLTLDDERVFLDVSQDQLFLLEVVSAHDHFIGEHPVELLKELCDREVQRTIRLPFSPNSIRRHFWKQRVGQSFAERAQELFVSHRYDLPGSHFLPPVGFCLLVVLDALHVSVVFALCYHWA